MWHWHYRRSAVVMSSLFIHPLSFVFSYLATDMREYKVDLRGWEWLDDSCTRLLQLSVELVKNGVSVEFCQCFVLYTCDTIVNVFTSNHISGFDREILRSSKIICKIVAENIWGKRCQLIVVTSNYWRSGKWITVDIFPNFSWHWWFRANHEFKWALK